jgi:SAM-dependent methyltransferase
MNTSPEMNTMSERQSLADWRIGPSVNVTVGPSHRRGESEASWNSGGQLQLDYLIAAGLTPRSRVLDIGCGALRAGRKIIAYLDPGLYYGIDPDRQLLDAGYELELSPMDLAARCPRTNLAHSAKFRHLHLTEPQIDFGICVSVMRGLSVGHVQVCLERVAPYFKPGGQLHISFLELPAGRPLSTPYTNMARFVSQGVVPPSHFYRGGMEEAALTSGWEASYIGQWGHPDGEVMISYEKI